MSQAAVKKRIIIRPEYCMACRLCEIACLVKHSRSKKILKAFKEEGLTLKESRIKVQQQGPMSFALQCRHCEDAWCVESCLSAALRRNEETGAILIDEDRCIGCWSCVMSCPYGVIVRKKKERKIATKCDLCPDEEQPACVVACPNEALILKEVK
jgi:carbon-monoxide dehydrogenase iron sulfur subunit